MPEQDSAINVLFADDERALRLIAERFLKRLGCVPHIAENGAQALAMLKAHPNLYDVLITDQNMPEMLGLELAAEIRKIGSSLPIILVTGFADSSDRDLGRSLGITEIISKPYTTETLSSAIERMVKRP